MMGIFDGGAIYYDKDSKDYVKRCRGPVDKTGSLPGLVYMNWGTGKMTTENGEPYQPVRTEGLKLAIKQIKIIKLK